MHNSSHARRTRADLRREKKEKKKEKSKHAARRFVIPPGGKRIKVGFASANFSRGPGHRRPPHAGTNCVRCAAFQTIRAAWNSHSRDVFSRFWMPAESLLYSSLGVSTRASRGLILPKRKKKKRKKRERKKKKGKEKKKRKERRRRGEKRKKEAVARLAKDPWQGRQERGKTRARIEPA